MSLLPLSLSFLPETQVLHLSISLFSKKPEFFLSLSLSLSCSCCSCARIFDLPLQPTVCAEIWSICSLVSDSAIPPIRISNGGELFATLGGCYFELACYFYDLFICFDACGSAQQVVMVLCYDSCSQISTCYYLYFFRLGIMKRFGGLFGKKKAPPTDRRTRASSSNQPVR